MAGCLRVVTGFVSETHALLANETLHALVQLIFFVSTMFADLLSLLLLLYYLRCPN